jgi:hypothetical protein
MLSKENIISKVPLLINGKISLMKKMNSSFQNYRGMVAVTAMVVFLFLSHCSGNSVYLVPKESPEGDKMRGERVDVKIRPIFTSDYQSEDREKYPLDFSSYFTAIEIQIHNGTAGEVHWSSEQTILKFGEKKEYQVLSEEDATHYYRYGDMEGKGVVLLEKPYEQQKEDVGNIKRFLIKQVSIPSGGDASGLLLFKKIPIDDCENVQLIVAGIKLNLEDKVITFPLECPKE